MTMKKIRLGNKKLFFTTANDSTVPDNSSGLIYPTPQGFAITDKRGETRLLILADKGGELCWFVSGRKHSGKFRMSHTSREDEIEFGLDRMKYDEVIALAMRIYRKCQQYLSEIK
ncbi:hypothetical protein [Klebsiella oxytoca]|uniref:hypothetical protein n=2 Tax=Enterobacterales TaxID=91347 RepID=UPI002342F34D|nr:hypothetical protein [Klebsiella oxytoca]MCX2459948.1 hypothetical protein [Citrobacter freundii complex sp. 2022EL-00972]HED2253877.1 hypothetical protein [Citrobacter freundii]